MSPQLQRHGALRGAVFLSALCTLTACSPKPAPPDPAAQTRRAVAKVFETAEPYSARKIATSDLDSFLVRNPEYLPDSATIVDFYRNRESQFAWILDNRLSASAESFITLAGVADKGGSKAPASSRRFKSLYDDAVEDGKRVPLCDTCAAELEFRLTAEFFRFAAGNFGGYLNTDVHDLNWFIPRAKLDFTRLLDSVSSGKMDLAGYQTAHPQAKLLLPHLRDLAVLVKEPWPELTLPANTKKLKAGDSASVIGDIRHRLQLLGDYTGDSAGMRYDTALVAGVKHFQTRHGLNPDAIIGAGMLSALNVTPAARMRTMLINTERLRWVAQQQPPNLLLVNIPEFKLHVFEDNAEVMTMNVVVGAYGTRTVTFTDTLTQIVFSPSWSIPSSIVRKEILPGIRKDPSYLAKHNMEITGGSKALPEVRQLPGASNALGRVKFLFPNSYNIYMHDTPSKGLFAGENRAASHGCVRVGRPADLAEYLLRNDSTWTQDKIDQAMFSGREQAVKLKEPRMVAIVYFTAWVGDDGALNFRNDIYGHDKELADELFAQGRATAAVPDSAR